MIEDVISQFYRNHHRWSLLCKMCTNQAIHVKCTCHVQLKLRKIHFLGGLRSTIIYSIFSPKVNTCLVTLFSDFTMWKIRIPTIKQSSKFYLKIIYKIHTGSKLSHKIQKKHSPKWPCNGYTWRHATQILIHVITTYLKKYSF